MLLLKGNGLVTLISVEVIKKSRDFLKVISNGSRFSINGLVFFYLHHNDSNFLKIGISVKKKAGNAVVRNKIKRQLRELFKSKSIDMAGLSMVVIVSENGSAIGSSYKSSSIAIDKFIDFLAKK